MNNGLFSQISLKGLPFPKTTTNRYLKGKITKNSSSSNIRPLSKNSIESNNRRPLSKNSSTINMNNNMYPLISPKNPSIDSLNKRNKLNSAKVPQKLQVMNLILKNSPSMININEIDKKMQYLNKDYNYKNLLNQGKEELYYRYNILYGSKSSNIIRTYSPKMCQQSSSISNYVKNKLNKNSSNCIFTNEQIDSLFFARCEDLKIYPQQDLHNNFQEFIKIKCSNRIIDLSECSIGFSSMKALYEILVNNPNICSRLILYKNNISDKGMEILVQILNSCDNLISLDLSSNNLGTKSGDLLFEYLINSQNIINLNISTLEGINRNRIYIDGSKHLFDVLQKNKFLEYLNLSGNSIKNEGFKYIVTGLNDNESLLKLDVSKNEIDEKGTMFLYNYLHKSNLIYFNISGNFIRNEGLNYLSKALATEGLSNVKILNISETKISLEGLKVLISKNNLNRKLNSIIASQNNLSQNGFNTFYFAMHTMNIKSLILSNCCIEKYANELITLLSSNNTIVHLDVSRNQFGDKVFKLFAQLLLENFCIISFDFSKNLISDASGVQFIENLHNNSRVKSINFYDNQLENKTANEIIKLLRKNKSFLKINLNSNRISFKLHEEIKNYIKKNNEFVKENNQNHLKSNISRLKFNPKIEAEIRKAINDAKKENKNIENNFEFEFTKYLEKEKDDSKSVDKIVNINNNLLNEIDNLSNEKELLNSAIENEKMNFQNDLHKIQKLIEDKKNEILDEKARKRKLIELKNDKQIELDIKKDSLIIDNDDLKTKILNLQNEIKSKNLILGNLKEKLNSLLNSELNNENESENNENSFTKIKKDKSKKNNKNNSKNKKRNNTKKTTKTEDEDDKNNNSKSNNNDIADSNELENDKKNLQIKRKPFRESSKMKKIKK